MTVTLAQIQSPEGSPVPVAWNNALLHVHNAKVARDGMRGATTQQMRDDAAVHFGQEIEKLFEQMLELRETGATGVITAYLCKRGR
mgnify:CR=1 FL=1